MVRLIFRCSLPFPPRDASSRAGLLLLLAIITITIQRYDVHPPIFPRCYPLSSLTAPPSVSSSSSSHLQPPPTHYPFPSKQDSISELPSSPPGRASLGSPPPSSSNGDPDFDDDAPPSYDSIFGPAQSTAATAGKALLGAATTGKRLSQMTAEDVKSEKYGSHTNPWSRKSVAGKHTLADVPMPDDGDVVALFDIDHDYFWCVEEEVIGGATIKLKKQGKHLSNGCLFTVRRIQKTNLEIHSAYRGREYQCLALQSSLNGKWISPNFRGRLHCDVKDVPGEEPSDKTWFSVETILAHRMRRGKRTAIQPMRFYHHRSECGVGQWVTFYESSIHRNPRLAVQGAYSKSQHASFFEMVPIRKAKGNQATQI